MAEKGIHKRKNPRLAGKVVEAIQAIHETEGATTKGITQYLQSNCKTGPEITENDVAYALMKAVDKGMVVAKGGRYKATRVAIVDAADGRRRRRSRSRGRGKKSRSKRRRSRKRSRGGRRRSRSRRRRHQEMPRTVNRW
ncbi:spermatid-specific protein T2-like [Ischnura elegans]|uniref:spermatid-specific protein T2-like n=1 Tax=Ischnura elegans TaxID=197161 RepID=UPI001ED880F4|nr:spermatid-specific protein T2-like [Ischnura elegans]